MTICTGNKCRYNSAERLFRIKEQPNSGNIRNIHSGCGACGRKFGKKSAKSLNVRMGEVVVFNARYALKILHETDIKVEHIIPAVYQREVPVAAHEQRRRPILIQPKM